MDCEKIHADSGLKYVLGNKCTVGKTTYIGNGMLKDLVDAFCTDDETKESIRALRRMESECRNRLAHELRPAKKEQLEQAGGMSLNDALARLFALHGSISPGLYDRINSTILQMM